MRRWRSDEWFADRDGSRRGLNDVRGPFSKRALSRGRKLHEAKGMAQVDQLTWNPGTGRPFSKGGRCNPYLNRFETRALKILRAAQIAVPEVREVDVVRGDA